MVGPTVFFFFGIDNEAASGDEDVDGVWTQRIILSRSRWLSTRGPPPLGHGKICPQPNPCFNNAF